MKIDTGIWLLDGAIIGALIAAVLAIGLMVFLGLIAGLASLHKRWPIATVILLLGSFCWALGLIVASHGG